MSTHEQRPLTFAEEREAAKARREARLEDALKRIRTPESLMEFDFRCGRNDPSRSWQNP